MAWKGTSTLFQFSDFLGWWLYFTVDFSIAANNISALCHKRLLYVFIWRFKQGSFCCCFQEFVNSRKYWLSTVLIMSHSSLCEIYCFSPCPCFFSNTYVLYNIQKGFWCRLNRTFVCPSVCLSVCVSVCLCVRVSVCLSVRPLRYYPYKSQSFYISGWLYIWYERG